MKHKRKIQNTDKARAVTEEKARQVITLSQVLSSVRRPSIPGQFNLLLELYESLVELWDYEENPDQQELDLK